jgi:hypothetical protein
MAPIRQRSLTKPSLQFNTRTQARPAGQIAVAQVTVAQVTVAQVTVAQVAVATA